MAPDTNDDLASLEDYAAQDFEAWKHKEGEWEPPSNEEWAKLADPHLMTIRVAWRFLYLSKPEFIEAFRKLEKAGALEATFDHLKLTSDFLKGLRELIDNAELRFISAGAAIAQSEGAAS